MASISQKLKPFMTPNYVIIETPPGKRQDGFKNAPSIHLREVPEETLLEMCEQFTKDVMAKHKSKPVN